MAYGWGRAWGWMKEGVRRGSPVQDSPVVGSAEDIIEKFHSIYRVSQVALVVKNPPANAEDVRYAVWSLGWEDPLEKEMTTHSSILAWETLWTEEPGGLWSKGLHRVRHDWSDLTQLTAQYSTGQYIANTKEESTHTLSEMYFNSLSSNACGEMTSFKHFNLVYLDDLGNHHNKLFCCKELIKNNTILRGTLAQVLIYLCLL